MGMLLTYHKGYRPEAEKPADEQPENTSPFADLTDEQVAEAYATNVGGRATKRETQEAALAALEAEADSDEQTGDNPDGGPEGEDDESTPEDTEGDPEGDQPGE